MNQNRNQTQQINQVFATADRADASYYNHNKDGSDPAPSGGAFSGLRERSTDSDAS